MSASSLPAPGRATQLAAEGRKIALFNVEGALHAIDDTCPHLGCALSDGTLDGTVVTCSCHGSQFDVTSGALRRGPATTDVARYAARVVGSTLELDMED